MITYTNRLDMHPGAVPLVIHLGQYDSDFSLVFNLFSSVGTFAIESSTTAEIRGTKKDGYGYSANATIDISNQKVTVAGHEQMTACAGQNPFELVLKKNNKVLSTANFILDVEQAALDADTITDESVLKELNAIIESAATATQAAETAVEAAERAAESSPLTDDIKTALLGCFQHVAWVDEHGQTYYDSLEAALYGNEYPKLVATFTQGDHVVYTDDSLSTLTPYLLVKYFEDVSDPGTTISSDDYTLSGTLTEGQSVVRVAYNETATTFTLIAVDYYNQFEWEWTEDEEQLHIINGTIAVVANTYNGAVINANTTMSANRRAFGAYKGKLPYSSYQTGDDLDYYPIPIPSSANQVTVAVTPAERYVQLEIVQLNNGIYSLYSSQGATQGEKTATFTAGENLFACVGTRYSNPDSAYSSPPTKFTVTFEEVE